jgi:hypothetical protein
MPMLVRGQIQPSMDSDQIYDKNWDYPLTLRSISGSMS